MDRALLSIPIIKKSTSCRLVIYIVVWERIRSGFVTMVPSAVLIFILNDTRRYRLCVIATKQDPRVR